MKYFTIKFQPIGKKVSSNKPISILEASNKIGLKIAGPCGGIGNCGKCKIKIVRFPKDTYLSPDVQSKKLISDTDLKKGYRLACQTIVEDDIEVELPPWSLELVGNKNLIVKGILVEGKVDRIVEEKYSLDSPIKIFHCQLPEPSLDNNISDLERIKRCISKEFDAEVTLTEHDNIEIPFNLMRDLTFRLHKNNWEIDLIVGTTPERSEILNVLPFNSIMKGDELKAQAEHHYQKSGCFGVAIDIGTSTIAAYLIDIVTGEELTVASAMNPQIRIGADIITRIRYTIQDKSGNQFLNQMLIDTINNLVKELCQAVNIKPHQIYDVVAVGNPTMIFNLLNIPIESLGSAPYTPIFTGDYYTPSSRTGLQLNNNGKVYTGPIVAGFLGADAVGTAMVVDMLNEDGKGLQDKDKGSKLKLALDIGTNGEIILGDSERILACSTAAGPAFEGGNLQFGTRAIPGAIYKMYIKNARIKYFTINGQAPCGITGSGTVDAISEFLRIGVIQNSGSIEQDNSKRWLKYPKRIRLKDAIGPTLNCELILPELMIVPKTESSFGSAIVITQNDIREIQLAKAAIRTGIEILMDELGVKYNDLDELYLAGAFGNYINPESAIGINMIPEIPIKRIKSIGNAAGISAKILLRSRTARNKAREIAKKIEYIDLATHTNFQDLFIQNMQF